MQTPDEDESMPGEFLHVVFTLCPAGATSSAANPRPGVTTKMAGERADIVIVGGGCIGTSTAYHLAKHGAGTVVLVEKGTVGSGPTGRSSGIVRMHYSLEPLIELALRSLAIFQNFADVVGGTADFTRTGFVLLAGPGDLPVLGANVRLQTRLGVRTSLLDPPHLAAMDPRLDLSDVGGAAYEPDSGYADGYATSVAFAAAARRLGVEIRENTAALRLRAENGRIAGVETPRGPIHAPRVLVSAGPWTPRLVAPLDVDLPIRTTRHQVAQVELPPAFGRIDHAYGDLIRGYYLRPDVGGHVLMGSIEETGEERVSADDFNPGMDFDFAERMAHHLAGRWPGAQEGRVRGGYASLYDVTPDWQPVLGEVEQVSGLFVAAGFSGHGFKLSPAIGETLAGLLTEGRGRTDLAIFRLARFRENALIRSPYAFGILG